MLFSSTKISNICRGYIFFSFAKSTGRIIGKNISENISSKYSQKLLDHGKPSVTDAIKTALKRAIQKEEDW